MNDPHVVSLTYRLKTREHSSFENPPPLNEECGAFSIRLEDGRLSATMNDHFASENEAKFVVDTFLRAWEICDGLKHGSASISFVFAPPAQIIDRSPPPQNGVMTGTINLTIGAVTCQAFARCSRSRYPEPPRGFAASADVQSMWHRYQMFLDGKDLILNMANFCQTVFEASTGKAPKDGARIAAAKRYNVDRVVLSTLGRMLATRGDKSEARKFDLDATRTPLTPTERQWVQQVVLALIDRKGKFEADSGVFLPQICMGQFVAL